jgi:hypothetical protein
MRKRTVLWFTAALLGSAGLVSTIAPESKATSPPSASLPSCTSGLATAVQALVPHVLPGTITQGLPAGTGFGGPTPATPFVSLVPAASATATEPATPAYCKVAFTYFPGAEGPNATVPPNENSPGVPYPAYNVGEKQAIQIEIWLPLGKADGGSGGMEGAWTGGLIVGGSPGSSGSLSWAAFSEGITMSSDPSYAIRQGFVGSMTDTGQTAAAAANAGSTDFAIIPSGPLVNKIAYGTVADWIYRGTHYGKEWADAIAKVYYGQIPRLHYYNGCSGGGDEGMGQLQNFGGEYDGFLIGAPAYRWQQFRQADSWPYLVIRKLVQLDGAAAALTTEQETSLDNAVLAKCDVEGTDTVTDGLIADPRLCTLNFTAQSQVCGEAGAPGAGACLTRDQAATMDRIWDGPRNSHGARLWYPYDISIPLGGGGFTGFSVAGTASVGLTASTIQVVQWNHANATWDAQDCLFVDQKSLELGTQNILGLGGSTGPFGSSPAIAACGSNGPGKPITYEEEQSVGSNGVPFQFFGIDNFSDNQNPVLLDAVRHGTKVMHIRGTADPAIRWRHDADYYNRVATWFTGGTSANDYAKLQTWYRFYPAPSVGHCGGGAGPQWNDPFLALRNWVEHGVVPTSLEGLTGSGGIDPGRTRPICSFPQTAIYKVGTLMSPAASIAAGTSKPPR